MSSDSNAGPKDGDGEITEECRPFRNGAGDNRNGGAAEGELEKEKHLRPGRGGFKAGQKSIESGQGTGPRAEHQPEPDSPEHRGADTEIHHVLDGDIDTAFRADQAGFEPQEARLHQQDQKCAKQDPGY